MSIAFFDLDRTLLAINSGSAWLRYELRAGRVPPVLALRAFAWLLRYSLGSASMEASIRAAVASVRGQSEADMRSRVGDFYARHIRDAYRPGARETLAEHRNAGHRLVLLTSSSNYVADLVCADLQLDDYLCNHFIVDANGLYTGAAREPLCFGAGKVQLAQRYADRIRVPLSECWFYSDSHSDAPMLEAVGKAVAVHPDPRLRRLAAKRGWPVADWGPS